MELLKQALLEDSVLLDVDAHNLQAVFEQTLTHLVERARVRPEDRERVEAALLDREKRVSTAIGHAVAVPHAYLECLSEPMIVFVRLAHPLNLGAPDGIPTHFFFVLLGPPGHAAEHLDTLTAIARLMSDDEFRYDVREAHDRHELLDALERFRVRTETVPAPLKKAEGLAYTGRLFGGVMDDLRRRLPHYADDIRDGLHSKCLSSTLFLFFACLAPAVTFGGVMAEYTDNHIGVVEMILASAACGVVYALVSGQPLIILGGTGPLLIFEAILYRLCVDLEIDYLSARAWVGMWSMFLLLVLAATDGCCLMRYFTRFTDEIFAALISLIFIVAAVEALYHAFDDPETNHDTALLSLLLALGTFYIAGALSRFRRSRYLLPPIREFLADFGPAIALGAMTVAAVLMHEVDLKKLPVPDRLQPSLGPPFQEAVRPWLINPLQGPRWVWFAAIAPAILATVLVYVDQNITARLVNSPDHRLQKGPAYHHDLAVVGVLIGACSLFGLPWLVAATVRSLNHVRSLATLEEVVSPGGDARERVIHVRENRMTGLTIHLLIGMSMLLLPLLKVVPMAVLYGLFLFMGVVSIAGNQFFERLSLWLMDSNLYPVTHYIRKVPMRVIHKFTLVQLVCLGVLGLVEVSPIGILFPLFVAMLVPVRILMERFFDREQLDALDAEEEPEEEEMQWV